MAQDRQRIPAQPAQPPRYGLLAAAPVVTDEEMRWALAGWNMVPEQCGVGGRVAIDCEGETVALVPDASPGTVEGGGFLVWAGDRCSTFGALGRDRAGLARRQLVATESYQIAEELWKGTFVNRALTDSASDELTTAAVSPLDAIARLEHGLARCGKGRRGMIHVTPQLLVHVAGAQAGAQTGNLWLTPTGNIIVADAGYDGSGPGNVAAGATQWAYATSMVEVRLGPIEVLDEMAVVLDRTVNTAVVIAHRAATVSWDECCHLAAEVSVPVPAIGGAG